MTDREVRRGRDKTDREVIFFVFDCFQVLLKIRSVYPSTQTHYKSVYVVPVVFPILTSNTFHFYSSLSSGKMRLDSAQRFHLCSSLSSGSVALKQMDDIFITEPMYIAR